MVEDLDRYVTLAVATSVEKRTRTRLIYDEPCWKGYEVVLDVWIGVFAILAWPTVSLQLC